MELKDIYTATQCTDSSDTAYAIAATKEVIAKLERSNKSVKAAYKRLLSLEKAHIKFTKKGN